MAETVAERRLREIAGFSSPEIVPTELITRDLQIIGGGVLGSRVQKYGVAYGLKPLYEYIGDATKVEWVKENAEGLGKLTAGTLGLLGLMFLRGKWTRLLAFGTLFKSVEDLLDYVEELVVPKK